MSDGDRNLLYRSAGIEGEEGGYVVRPRLSAIVCFMCLFVVSCAGTRTASSVPTMGKTGEAFEKEYLASRLHHHAEMQTLVNTCIAKSERAELIAFCKEINATADRIIGQLRQRAKEWYGIAVPPEADEEHGEWSCEGGTFSEFTLDLLEWTFEEEGEDA